MQLLRAKRQLQGVRGRATPPTGSARGNARSHSLKQTGLYHLPQAR